MGFYIRKSVRVGPLRFNLSKSGIGVSTGIPGLRVGSGPRGTYVHMGSGGLYYRQTLSSPKSRRQQPNRPLVDLAVAHSHTHGPLHAVGSGCVTEMVDTNSDTLLSEIDRKQKRIMWWPIVLVMSLILGVLLVVAEVTLLLTVPCILLLTIATVFVHQYDQLKKSVVLMYELDGPSLKSYQNLYAAVNDMASCGAVWHVTAKGDVYDPKYHAGAGYLINRRPLSVGYRNPPYVKTNLSVPVLPFGKHSMYLLPDRILVYAPNGVGAVEYDGLTLSARPTPFIEDGTVPCDATVVDHTWQYVNKGGGPDRRFNNNRRIPICQYEELQITNPTGVREILQLSRLGVSAQLDSAISAMVDGIRTAEAAEVERNRLVEQRRLQSLRNTSTTESKETERDAVSPPTPQMLLSVLFDILCCVMVADGRASTSEKSSIHEIMSKVNSGWSDDKCNGRISSFIGDIQCQGYATVLRRSMSQLRIFKQSGREDVLVKCIDLVANADSKLTQRERELCDRIRKSIGVAASKNTEQNVAPESQSRVN